MSAKAAKVRGAATRVWRSGGARARSRAPPATTRRAEARRRWGEAGVDDVDGMSWAGHCVVLAKIRGLDAQSRFAFGNLETCMTLEAPGHRMSGSPLTSFPVETHLSMSLYSKPSSSTSFATEFDILKASHKFLREDEEDAAEAPNASWNDQLAQKYYGSLFREFAVCDLKHYKSGNVRTPTFVVS